MEHFFSDFAIVKDVYNYKIAKGVDTATPLIIPNSANFQGVVDYLADHHIGVALVCDENKKIVGIVSERDIVQFIAVHGISALEGASVAALISEPLITCELKDPLRSVSAIMAQEGIRHIGVVNEDGDCLGVISASDIVLFAGEG